MFALVGLLAVGAGCGSSAGEPDRAGAPGDARATVKSSDVTLTGQVTRAFGQYVIQLGTTPREPVLVVFRTPSAYPVGARLEVSGRVRTFARAEIEAEFGVPLGSEVESFDGSRCVVAASVRLL